ncbi:hypothetical protein [Sagittula sp. S175]|uniref:hypothetical protein n=1 Tax=Sagittula sp. S175 TaxID=3415129 RepID=UPI003C7C8F13
MQGLGHTSWIVSSLTGLVVSCALGHLLTVALVDTLTDPVTGADTLAASVRQLEQTVDALTRSTTAFGQSIDAAIGRPTAP